jgi:hypothetical protein
MGNAYLAGHWCSSAILNFLGHSRASGNPGSSADRREGALINTYR